MHHRSFLCLMAAGAAVFFTACAANDAESNRYTITGDVSAAYSNGEFVVWVAAPKGESGGATGMAAATPASGGGDPQKSMKDSLNIVAEAPIVDGKFFLEGTTDAPRNVYFYVLGAVTPEGRRLAPMKGQAFILEPGDLKLTMSARARFLMEGGHYNDIVVNSWKRSPEYIALTEAYNRKVAAVDGETEDERRARTEQASETYSAILDLENEGRRKVAMSHEDPLARKLTLQSTWLRDRWFGDAVRALAEVIPDDPWIIDALASEEQYAAARARRAQFAVGAEIRDFEAETLDGETVSIAGARQGKEVVLVEFWASWCGPCRVEIPHMKQAYADYGPLGFEIFSFTVDDEREDWEEASEEEQLPWIDAGMGMDHSATETYGVTGVPANFLVDAGSGEIIARNLRGHKLDEALAERFGKAGAEG